MYVAIGIVVVFAAVGLGYLMEHGHFSVLFQPAELVIIGGAGSGRIYHLVSQKSDYPDPKSRYQDFRRP